MKNNSLLIPIVLAIVVVAGYVIFTSFSANDPASTPQKGEIEVESTPVVPQDSGEQLSEVPELM